MIPETEKEAFMDWVMQHDSLMEFLQHNEQEVIEFFGGEWTAILPEDKADLLSDYDESLWDEIEGEQ